MDLNRLGRGILGNAYARLFGVDDVNAVPTLAPEIMPTTSIWERPEFWALFGGSLCTALFQATAPGAGNVNVMQLRVPPTQSTLLVIVTRLIIADASLVEWGALASGDSGGTESGKQHRDTRKAVAGVLNSGIGASVEQGSEATFAVSGGEMLGPAIVPLEYILGPGHRFLVVGTPNAAINCTLEWRERQCHPNELSLF